MSTVDLLIAGAGPAGLSTALHLLQLDPGWADHLLVLEKASHPRHKLCGGGVTRLGLDLLKELGFSLPLPIPQARVDDVRLVYRDRVVHVRGEPQLAIFHRQELDAYLAEQARQRGVRILENTPVFDYKVSDYGVDVSTAHGEYHAQVLVGADGSKGAVRQAFARGERRIRVARLLETVQAGDEADAKFTQRYALFDFNSVRENLQGYFWDFPSCQGGQLAYNRGVYDARLVQRRPRANLPALLRANLQDLDGVRNAPRVEGHPIHWFSPFNRFSTPRVLLVGDAAGAEPLFGEGIAPALGYGKVAAQALQYAFDSRDFSFSDYRRRLQRSRVGRYLMTRWLAAEGSYRFSGKPWFMHMVWSIGDMLARLWPKPEPLY